MDNKKFEQLIDLIINENEEQAKQLFHEIIVEKSREIYESIMDEEMMDESMHGDMDEGMVGEVGELLDEIGAEEEGQEMSEEEDEDISIDDEEEVALMPGDEEDDGMDGEDLEDRVGDMEEKVDELERLMAEFQAEMGGDDDMDMGDEEETVDVSDEEEAMMEAVQLQKVSVTHGDNGVQTRSPSLQNSGQAGMDSHPVKFSGASESVPTGPKGPSNAYAKGETSVKGAGNFKNSPGKDNFKEKGDSTPKPVSKDGAADKHSPVAKS
jgi:hypothetical protein